jgi:NCS1 family nucleobase:cation symporter-1
LGFGEQAIADPDRAEARTNSKKFMSAQNRQAVRLIGILFIFVVGTILACLSSAHFYSSFENFIGVLLFFFVPWSAINLVDYYLVKHGRYDVQSFFKPDGIYGGFQWWACLCYVITLAVQVPFLDQLFYVGPLVKPLGGADISWIVGFGVASLLYWRGRGASSTSSRGRRPGWVRRLKVSCGGGVS